MATKMITASIDDETEFILKKIKEIGVMGTSKFIREAAKNYRNNGFKFVGEGVAPHNPDPVI